MRLECDLNTHSETPKRKIPKSTFFERKHYTGNIINERMAKHYTMKKIGRS